ncbi:hypothetical protein C8R45DRAFT_1115635 [Mycena sanguinolenta]|nr:hypothetical protein C8R45DRAFT_1115635 [Mycena sanguinolenta]
MSTDSRHHAVNIPYTLVVDVPGPPDYIRHAQEPDIHKDGVRDVCVRDDRALRIGIHRPKVPPIFYGYMRDINARARLESLIYAPPSHTVISHAIRAQLPPWPNVWKIRAQAPCTGGRAGVFCLLAAFRPRAGETETPRVWVGEHAEGRASMRAGAPPLGDQGGDRTVKCRRVPGRGSEPVSSLSAPPPSPAPSLGFPLPPCPPTYTHRY